MTGEILATASFYSISNPVFRAWFLGFFETGVREFQPKKLTPKQKKSEFTESVCSPAWHFQPFWQE